MKSLAKIYPIKLFKDNYSYLIINSTIPTSGMLIDPAEPQKILTFLENFKNLKISQVFFTHKHWDHSGDPILLRKLLWKRDQNKELVFLASDIDSQEIKDIDIKLTQKQGQLQFNKFDIDYYIVPCHTKGHVLYHFKGGQNQDIQNPRKSFINEQIPYFQSNNFCFTGDTLFIGGCGRFFEGNAEEMSKNFNLIKSFSDDTHLFCGHEYTQANLNWAQKITKDENIQNLQEDLKNYEMSIPSNVYQEKKINLFMRTDEPEIQQLLQCNNQIEAMLKLRTLKNENKGLVQFKL